PIDVLLYDTLSPGMEGAEVKNLQAGLGKMDLPAVNEGGWYGPRTREAVKRLQAECGLPEDGVAGINEGILIMSETGGGAMPRLGRAQELMFHRGGAETAEIVQREQVRNSE
ncbi:MAG: peptidoglycan-binding domain-containing protein, partial [bacterium]